MTPCVLSTRQSDSGKGETMRPRVHVCIRATNFSPVRLHRGTMPRSTVLLALLLTRTMLAQKTPATAVPLRPGLAVVSAIAGVGRRDYEIVVAVATAGDAGVGLVAHSDADSYGRPKRITVTRRVPRADIAAAPVQILGFSTEDAASFPGTTALGPSLAMVRE